MIRFLRAFAWLRLRLFINSLRGATRRDRWERLSRLLGAIVPIVLFLIISVVSVGLGGLAFWGGMLVAEGQVDTSGVLIFFRLFLFILLPLLVLLPLGRSPQGGTASLARLLLLPIPRRSLHLVEVLSTVADPWIMMVIPSLLLFPAGMLVSGRPLLASGVLAGGLLTIALLACLGAFVSHLLQYVLRGRRRREIATLLFMMILIPMSFVPALVSHTRDSEGKRGVRIELGRGGEDTPIWARPIPSELYAQTALDLTQGSIGGAGAALAGLALEVGILFGLSSLLHAKLLAAGESGDARRRLGSSAPGGFRLPGLSPLTSAVVQAHVRTLLRSVRGKLSVLLPGPIILLLALVVSRVPSYAVVGRFIGDQGPTFFATAGVLCLLSIQPFTLNQFAVDRAGLAMLFVSPLEDRTILRGKAIGGALLLVASLLLCMAACLAAVPGGSPALWLSVLAGHLATYNLLAPVSAILSLLLPKPADLNSMGSRGNAHGGAAFIGTLATVVAALPSTIIVGAAGLLFSLPWLALGLSLVWLLLTAVLATALLDMISGWAASRRENIYLLTRE